MKPLFLRRWGDNLFMIAVLIGGLVVLPLFFLMWLVLGMPKDNECATEEDVQEESKAVEEEHWQ